MRVKMCSIHVEDPAKAFAFYTETLGFAELMAVPEASLYIVVSPQDATGMGLLLEPSDSPIAQAYRKGLYDAGTPAIVLGVDNIQAEYARLAAAGVRFTGEPTTDPYGTHVVFDDTCGNYVQLHQD